MGNAQEKTKYGIEVTEAHLQTARRLLPLLHHNRLKLVSDGEGSGFVARSMQTTLNQLEPIEGHICTKWQGTTGQEQDIFINALQYLAETANLIGYKRLWSMPDFKSEIVDTDPLPVFCSLCGEDFFPDVEADENEKKHKLINTMPEKSRVVSFSCGNHHAHLACMLFTPANTWSKVANDHNNNIHARAIHIPKEECDENGKFALKCECSVCSWRDMFSDSKLTRFLLRPQESGTLILSPLFRLQDINYVAKFMKYGDLVDVSGYRFRHMYIVNSDGELERLPGDDACYGLIPWEYYRHYGVLHYYNMYGGAYKNRIGNIPLGHGIFNNGGIFDVFSDPNAPPMGEMDRRPLRTRITHDSPGSLIVDAEGVDRVHEYLDHVLQVSIERQESLAANNFNNGGVVLFGGPEQQQQQQMPLPTSPVVKSVKMMEKNGTWTEIPIYFGSIIKLPLWALYAKRPVYWNLMSKFYCLEISFKTEFSPNPCESIIFRGQITRQGPSCNSGVMHITASAVPSLRELVKAKIAFGAFERLPKATLDDYVERLDAMSEEKKSVVIKVLNGPSKCTSCGGLPHEHEYCAVPSQY